LKSEWTPHINKAPTATSIAKKPKNSIIQLQKCFRYNTGILSFCQYQICLT
jgi:hypothetical protein